MSDEVIVNGKKYQLGRVYSDDARWVVLLTETANGKFKCQHFRLRNDIEHPVKVTDLEYWYDELHIAEYTPTGFQAGTITPVIEPKKGEWWLCEVTVEKNIAMTETFGRVLQYLGDGNWLPLYTATKPIHKMVKAED